MQNPRWGQGVIPEHTGRSLTAALPGQAGSGRAQASPSPSAPSPRLRSAAANGLRAAPAGGFPWPGTAQPSTGLCGGELALGKEHGQSDTLTESEPRGPLTRLPRSEQRSRHLPGAADRGVQRNRARSLLGRGGL